MIRIQEDWKLILASILLAKSAVATFSIAPFLIGSYIDHLHLSVAEASRTLSVEIFALAISNACAFFWIHKVSCRQWAQRFLLMLIVLNIACIYAPNNEILLVIRALIGAAEGALLALGFGLLGVTQRPNRNFGLYFAISLSVGAINIRILPVFIETAGVTGLYANLSLYGIIALLGTAWIRKGRIRDDNATAALGSGTQPSQMTAGIAIVPLVLLMLANYVYFIGQGGVWSFLERLGAQYEIGLSDIATALSYSLIAGVAGGATAGWLDLKIGRIVPMLAAIAFAITSIIILLIKPTAANFTIAAILFNFGNNMGHPYVLGFAAQMDKTSRLTVLSSALHTGGQATGPIIAGLIVTAANYTSVLWLGIASFSLTIALLLPVALVLRSNSINE